VERGLVLRQQRRPPLAFEAPQDGRLIVHETLFSSWG
jgi:hypothetical protein